MFFSCAFQTLLSDDVEKAPGAPKNVVLVVDLVVLMFFFCAFQTLLSDDVEKAPGAPKNVEMVVESKGVAVGGVGISGAVTIKLPVCTFCRITVGFVDFLDCVGCKNLHCLPRPQLPLL